MKQKEKRMKYKLQKGLIVQKLDDKITIFDGEESTLYTFNETASYIFAKIKLGWEKKKLIDALEKKYGISQKKAEKDIDGLIRELRKKKIIQLSKID